MPAEDEELPRRLEQALGPSAVEPSEAEITALHEAVAEGAANPPATLLWPRRALAGVAAAAVLIVIVSGAPMPRPIRAAAHAVGLPVDSVEVAEAKSAVKELRRALDRGDQERTARASARVRQRLGALNEKDRQTIGGQAEPLLQRASVPQGSPPPPPGRTPSGAPLPSPPPTGPQPTSQAPVTSTTSTSTTSTTARTETTAGAAPTASS